MKIKETSTTVLAFAKKNIISIIIGLIGIVFLLFWLNTAAKLNTSNSEVKASKKQIKQLKSEIEQAKQEFIQLQNAIKEHEKNRPTPNSNANVNLDDLLFKMQQRFETDGIRALLQ